MYKLQNDKIFYQDNQTAGVFELEDACRILNEQVQTIQSLRSELEQAKVIVNDLAEWGNEHPDYFLENIGRGSFKLNPIVNEAKHFRQQDKG